MTANGFWPFIRNQRWTLLMLSAILIFYSLTLPGRDIQRLKEREQGQPSPAQEEKAAVEKIRARELLFQKRLKDRPEVVAPFAGLIFLMLLGGLLVDSQIFWCFLKRRPWVRHKIADPDLPLWGPSRVVQFCVLLLFLEIGVYLFWAFICGWFGIRPFNSDILIIVSTFFRDILATIYVIFIVKKVFAKPLSAVGLSLRHFWQSAWTGVTAYLAVIPVLAVSFILLSAIFQLFSYEPKPQRVVEIYLKQSSEPFLPYITIFVAMAGPIMEEIFFRGFIYKAFRWRFGVRNAILISSAIFALVHFNPVAAIPIFILGVFLTVLYQRTGSLVAPIGAHVAHNLLMVSLTMFFKSLTT